jgi:excisionase family DNA binding protein
MHHRLQSDIRENPASDRRHGSRQVVRSLSDASLIEEETATSPSRLPSQKRSSIAVDSTPNAAACHADIGDERRTENECQPVGIALKHSQNATLAFEPLIGSLEAATLLGHIHVKTLQRYARHRRVPGYQIGGHWYFRASELDSWLRSQINLSCHPCRLGEKSDGT